LIWPSVRQELWATQQALPLMYADVGAPIASCLFASDAMGQNNDDHGGFGIVGADVPSETLSNVYRTGTAVGRTLARLSGELTGLRDPLRDTKRTVPFTYLPQSLFDLEVTDWRLLEQGRWRFADKVVAISQRLGWPLDVSQRPRLWAKDAVNAPIDTYFFLPRVPRIMG
jgi:hypothetical protein